MPKSSVKTKKAPPKVKTNSRSPFEPGQASSKPFQDDSDVEMDREPGDEEDEDEEKVREKDEAEKKLERMLFGDDEGFQGALRDQQDRGLKALVAQSDDEDISGEAEGAEGEDDDGEGLEDVADADVRVIPGISFFLSVVANGLETSFFSLIPEPVLLLLISLSLPRPHPTPKTAKKTKARLRCGMTATTSISPFPWRTTKD